MIYFPKEVWYQIRSYEFQLCYPPEIQLQCKSYLNSIVRLPYLLKIENQKSIVYLYSFVKEHHPFFWKVFTDKYIRECIRQEMVRMDQTYHKTYVKRACRGFNSGSP